MKAAKHITQSVCVMEGTYKRALNTERLKITQIEQDEREFTQNFLKIPKFSINYFSVDIPKRKRI